MCTELPTKLLVHMVSSWLPVSSCCWVLWDINIWESSLGRGIWESDTTSHTRCGHHLSDRYQWGQGGDAESACLQGGDLRSHWGKLHSEAAILILQWNIWCNAWADITSYYNNCHILWGDTQREYCRLLLLPSSTSYSPTEKDSPAKTNKINHTKYMWSKLMFATDDHKHWCLSASVCMTLGVHTYIWCPLETMKWFDSSRASWMLPSFEE